jgi:hypothetical protein
VRLVQLALRVTLGLPDLQARLVQSVLQDLRVQSGQQVLLDSRVRSGRPDRLEQSELQDLLALPDLREILGRLDP